MAFFLLSIYLLVYLSICKSTPTSEVFEKGLTIIGSFASMPPKLSQHALPPAVFFPFTIPFHLQFSFRLDPLSLSLFFSLKPLSCDDDRLFSSQL